MSKKTKIILTAAAALLVLVTTFLTLLPRIVRWYIPRVIEAKSGYQAAIETIDFSVSKPAITIGGISLQAGAGGGVMGKVALVSFSGAWGNPFRRHLISPVRLIIQGIDARLELLAKKDSESSNLDFLFSLLLQFQVVTIEAEQLAIVTPDGLFKMTKLNGSITPPKDQDGRKNRSLKGSVLLTASGKTGTESAWKTQGQIALSGEITPEGNANGVITVGMESLASSQVQASAVAGHIPFSYENNMLKVQDARLGTPAVRIQSVYEQSHSFPLQVEPLQATLTTTKPYALSAQATVSADDLLSLKISLSGKAGDGLSGSLTLAIPELKSVTSHAAFQEKKDVLRYKGITLAGGVLIEGQFQLIMDRKVPSVAWQADCRLDTVRTNYMSPLGAIEVTLHDLLKVRGRNAAVELSGDVGFTQLRIQSSRISIEDGNGRVQFSADANRVEIKETKVSIDQLRFKQKPAVMLKNVSFRGSGIVDVSAQNVKNASAILSIDGMGPFSVSLVSFSPLDATLQAKDVSLKNVLDKIKPVSGFFEGWQVDGSLDLSLRARGDVDLSGTVSLHLAKASDPRDVYVAENLSTSIIFTSYLKGLTSLNRLEARAGIERGEALLGSFYLDFGLTPFTLALNLSSASTGLQVSQGTMELAKAGTARFHSRENELFPLEVSLDFEDLNQFFTACIQSSLAAAYPILNDIHVQGKAACDLSLQPDSAQGRFRLDEASLTIGSSLNVQGFALDLPWAYSTGKRPLLHSIPQTGKIKIGLLETERFQIRNQEIGLHFEPNKFTFDPVRFPLADGIVLVSDAAVENTFSGNPKISLLIGLRDIRLAKLQLLPPPYELTGTLACNGLRISGDTQRLDGAGEVTVDLFGGHAEASDFSMQSPLSRFRRLICNIKFEDVDLEKFTRAFSFGRITGKLNGYLNKLAISNGQADAFTLEVWSVAAKGVPRRVSFNAVNDIQTISTGSEYRSGLPFGLDRFIGDLSYERIGIKCILKNDVFNINGTIHKDHIEYFVSHAGFAGINVINMNPDNQIDFKDMMERIKRVAEKREAEVK
jgi:hypothetical protein